MSCAEARISMFRLLDRALSEGDDAAVREHLASCTACAREFRMLELPRRLGRALPPLAPSPFFYQRLRAQIEASEGQGVTLWPILTGLSRQVFPALASITLLLVSIFMYTQLRSGSDFYQSYDSIFLSGDRPQTLVIVARGDITDDSVLLAIAESEPPPPSPHTEPGKR